MTNRSCHKLSEEEINRRLDKVEALVREANGTMTRYGLCTAMCFSDGVISGLVKALVEQGRIGDTKGQPKFGGSIKSTLFIPVKVTEHDYLKGWGKAPVLGLKGWESTQQKGSIHIHYQTATA